jgi:hypothetical protein
VTGRAMKLDLKICTGDESDDAGMKGKGSSFGDRRVEVLIGEACDWLPFLIRIFKRVFLREIGYF